MAVTVSLLSPVARAQFQVGSTATYTADAFGMISGVPIGQDVRDLVNDGCVVLGFGVIGRNNYTAAVDPTPVNDNTQDYAVGSVWVNSANGRVWTAQAVGTGAAAWALAVVPGVGVEPAANLEQMGNGVGVMLSEGNVYRNVPTAAINPATTANDNVLAVYSLPAGSFDVSGRGLFISATGTFANNTNVKQVKLWFNATTAVVGSAITGGVCICDSGAYSTTGLVQWELNANVFKTGVAGSNTQRAFGSAVVIGSTHSGFGAGASAQPQALTATESGAILLAVTGAAATLATDIGLVEVNINAMN